MKALRYIAVLSLALFGAWVNASRASAVSPTSYTTLSDTTEPYDPSIKLLLLFSDTSQPETAASAMLADSSEEDGDPPVPGAKASPLESIEDTPAGEIYDDWDTTSVHSDKFDALTFDDTIRIPLKDPGHCQYVHPFNGTTTSSFGFRKYRYHFGVDINLETGDSVRCAFDGKVRIAQKSKTYGYVVVIRHNNGLETYYAHLSKLMVKPGDAIEAGMTLGLGGNTGHSYGSHLHFEMRFRGVAIDPNYLIDFKNQTLRTDTYCLTKSDFKYLTQSFKVKHYSRKRKKTWYTYYCPGGAHYATAEAKAIMARVPAPHLPGTPATTCEAPAEPATFKEVPAANSTAPKKPATTKPATTNTTQKPQQSKTNTTTKPVTPGAPVYYTVKSGDSLYAISLKYHTTVEKICALNNIKKTSVLSIGKKLRVK
ncbi:MAG: peptidoglycan DD-metalloendopeptidase family protein [Bacteroidota bacterium]|nr:peptidoglycan DD-metalloendopeptidase family protein [Bacteroidota bacterium]